MNKTMVTIILLLFSFSVIAGEMTLTWTNATSMTDDSLIPTDVSDPNSLAKTEIEYGTCSVVNVPEEPYTTVVVDTTTPGAQESFKIDTIEPGVWCVWAKHQLKNGVYSAYSAPVSKTILDTPVVPDPPTDFNTIETIAYTLVKQIDRFILLPVGTVAVGTKCDPTQYVNGYYVVPITSVTFSGTVRPVVVVAKCG